MNELYIYKKLNYRDIIKKANIHFCGYYNCICPKTIFAKKNNTYSISINKNSIRICYWDELSKNGIKSRNQIKRFLLDNFSGETLIVSKNGECDILKELNNIKIIQLM